MTIARKAMVCGVLLAFGLAMALAAQAADEGSRVFNELKCGLCHKPDQSGAGPSLQAISLAYLQQRQALIAYLGGTAPARLGLNKPNLMQGPLNRIQKRSPEEIGALADHLLNPKPR